MKLQVYKDPISAWSHFLAFLVALVAVPVLIAQSADDPPKAAAMTVYGISLLALLLASSSYHFFDLGETGNDWLQRFDHAAVFLLIGGTYVPPLVVLLEGVWRAAMLSAVGGLSLGGAVVKLLRVHIARGSGVALYLGLGWMIVIPGPFLLPQLPGAALAWLLAGGVAYTAGAVVYAKRWPDPWPSRFGHHEIWHLFVVGGAVAHYLFMLTLLPIRPASP